MSDNKPYGFGAFVPGFDFLQGLVQSAAQGKTGGSPPGMPDWSKWVAPTLQPDEIEKRVNELKTVQFWLEQNAKALAATIQALEVQKMTLATLRGMNVPMQDFAHAFGFGSGAAPAESGRAGGSGRYDDMFTQRPAQSPAAQAAPSPAPAPAPAPAPEPAPSAAASPAAASASAPAAAPAVDPLQWWNALAGQFQQIAAGAMQEAAARAAQSPGLQDAARQAFDAAGRMATEVASAAAAAAAVAPAPPAPAKAATRPARKHAAAAKKAAPARKPAVAAVARKKPAARKSRP